MPRDIDLAPMAALLARLVLQPFTWLLAPLLALARRLLLLALLLAGLVALRSTLRQAGQPGR